MKLAFDVVGVFSMGLLLVVAQAVLFTIFGARLFSKSLPDFGEEQRDSWLRLGFFFFIGLAMFLAFFRLVDLLAHNARLSLGLTLTVVTLVSLTKVQRAIQALNISPVWFTMKRCLLFVFGFVGVSIFTFMVGATSGIREHLGSGHVDQYSMIAAFISEMNFIPSLGRHYGQSILASIPLIFGFPKPALVLYLWLAVSKTMLLIFVFGFFSTVFPKGIRKYIATSLLFIGQTSLSLVWVHNVDSITPFIGSEYTDSMTGIGTFFAFLLVLFQQRHDRINLGNILLLFLGLSLFWAVSAPINLVFGALVVIYWLVINVTKIITRKDAMIVLGVVIVGVGISIIQGGSLTPKSMRTDHAYADRFLSATGQVEIFPRFPYYYFSGPYFATSTWHRFTSDEINDDMSFRNRIQGIKTMHTEELWDLENKIWTAIRVQFFGLLGLLLFIPNVSRSFGTTRLAVDTLRLTELVGAVALVVGSGMCASFWFSLGDMKWPVSRFNLLGVFFGLMVTVLWLMDSGKKGNRVCSGIIISIKASCVALMLAGPVSNFVVRALNVSLLPRQSDVIHELIIEDFPSDEVIREMRM
jgi:hypothetical protein